MKKHDDADLYEQAAVEIGSGKPDRGLYAKAYSEALGDVSKTRALYIQFRVEQLKADLVRDRGKKAAAMPKPQVEDKRKESTPLQKAGTPDATETSSARFGVSGPLRMRLLSLIELLRSRLKTVINVSYGVLTLVKKAAATPKTHVENQRKESTPLQEAGIPAATETPSTRFGVSGPPRMGLLSLIEFLRSRLKTVIYVSYAALALVVVADIVRSLTATRHGAGETAAASAPAAHGFWGTLFHVAENVPVFWTIFGFVGCVLLVIVSKTLLSGLVARPEDHYDE